MMRGRSILLTLVAVCFALAFGAEGYSKIDPWTNSFLGPWQDVLIEHGLYRIDDNPVLGRTIDMFIKTDGSQGCVNAIRELGVQVNTVIGDRLTARVPLDLVDELVKLDEVIYIQAGKQLEPLNNLGVLETGADNVHSGTSPLPRGFTGSAVLAAVIDGGIYWNHPDFKCGGSTRIQYLWDQSVDGSPPAGFSYGTEWTASQINGGSCTEVDGDDDGGGHGSHVAGSVFGNGAASSGTYAGMAPDADIIFVKTPMSDVQLVDATNYCFQKADAIGKAISVNMSIGGHYGPHDGTSPCPDMISDLTGAGHIISIAAGNENGMVGHAGYTATSETTYTDFYSGYTDYVAIDLWYPASGSINIGVAAWDFETFEFLAFTGLAAPGDSGTIYMEDPYGYPLGYVKVDATETSNPYNGDRHVIIEVMGEAGMDLTAVGWDLVVSGSGRFDSWILMNGEFDTYTEGYWIGGDNDYMVGIPGDAANAVTVASYVTREAWTDIDGNYHTEEGVYLDDISNFSSHGPTRDGRTKPEIAAPGQFIISTLSGDLTETVELHESMIDYYYQKMEGTSMACPHVTGAIALLLERDGTFTPAEIKSILASTAVSDGYTGSVPNYIWGYGKMEIFDAMCYAGIERDVKGSKPVVPHLGQNFPNPFNAVTSVGYYLPEAAHVKLTIHDVIGRQMALLVDEEQSAGIHTVKYFASDDMANELPTGIYFCKLTVGDHAQTRKMILAK